MSEDPTESDGWNEAARNADVTITLPGGVPMYFRRIPGTAEAGLTEGFLMGSRGYAANEEPQHSVIIPQQFYLGTFPVTQEQFGVWTKATRKVHENESKGQTFNPAESMSWHEAKDYCEWLCAVVSKASFPSGFEVFCMPTEAEWEWACRGLTQKHPEGVWSEYHNGDGETALASVGWYNGNRERLTHPVGQKSPNGHGLYDMHGNVWEWCADVYDRYANRKRSDGWMGEAWTIEQSGEDLKYWDEAKQHPHRVLRGGSWRDPAWLCRSTSRTGSGPIGRFWDLGFRVSVVPGPAAGGAEVRQEADGTGDPGAATDLSRYQF